MRSSSRRQKRARGHVPVALFAGLSLALGCRSSEPTIAAAEERATASANSSDESPAPAPRQALATEGAGRPAEARRVEVIAEPVPGDLDVFVLRARVPTRRTVVFMHGMCGHGLGYVQSFQWSAVDRANVIGLQGDIPCDGDGTWRKWGRDLETLDRRIDAALTSTGLARSSPEIILAGYSQGGTRALELGAKYPARYAELVIIGAPKEALARELAKARTVVVMAGEHDAPKWRKSQAHALGQAGIRAAFFELPAATHGDMGPDATRVMGEVLDFIAAGGDLGADHPR